MSLILVEGGADTGVIFVHERLDIPPSCDLNIGEVEFGMESLELGKGL